MLMCSKVKIKDEKIGFLNKRIQWQISSPVDEFIQHLIMGIFAEGQEIEIGPEDNVIKLVIEKVETLPGPEFKESMRFTCLSPITVSSIVSPFHRSTQAWNRETVEPGTWNGGTWNMEQWNDSKCYYLRPWEEGFSEAIKNNLIKKYRLIYGKDINDAHFEIKIDPVYMNKRAGKIIKNINFKDTNIIGFMAPFEVRGSPELIEVGYEAGFGEKGSMGFGMVKINNRSTTT
jgi:CRISPR-associated endoribonuclease Cas6